MRWYENPDLYWVIGCCLVGCSGVFAVLLFFGAVSVITGVANILSTLALAITCYVLWANAHFLCLYFGVFAGGIA